VTYSNQIARILQRHCVECHRPGEIAPFSLTDYDEVVGWAKMIEEVVDQQRMPPWHADPRYGRFANARLLSAEEKQLIHQWVSGGAPRGEPEQLPEPRQFTSGWRLPRQPDLVLPMRNRPFQVPAEGIVEYQYFVVDPGFEQETWVSGAEIIPGNRAVVHHAIVFIRPPDGVSLRGIGWLTAYVPGQTLRSASTGQATRVPAGSKLVFQMHYTPTGSQQQDLTKVGLLLMDRKDVTEEIITQVAIDRDFEIPPRAANHRVVSTISRFPAHGKLLAIAPHMHLRGKSFRFVAHQGGQSDVLLHVPRYDFNWQTAYQLETPRELVDGLSIECIAEYDNSADNLSNPDPDATVHWGDQTFEEMFLAYFAIAIPLDRDTGPDPAQLRRQRERAHRIGRQFIQRFDSNGDGKLVRSELPASTATFAFGRLDRNGDEVITNDEAVEAARQGAGRRIEGAP
jgi:hypothetical protein